MMEVNKKKLETLFHKIKYSFKNIIFCVNALTHSSYDSKNYKTNYQRLEFLGDRVLGLIISEAIFKRFKNEEEGKKEYSHGFGGFILECRSLSFLHLFHWFVHE